MGFAEDRIDPQLRALLPVLPKVDVTDPPAFREAQRAQSAAQAAGAAPLPGVAVEDRTIPAADPGGPSAPDILVRVYTPTGTATGTARERGVLVWFHGGGYVFGDVAGSDRSCAALAVEADCVVVSVEYRLAPENPYPAALEDAYAALVWTAANAAELGGDPARIAIGGVSAGAGLTAALALFVRDKGGPALVLQLLDNPMLDDRVGTASAAAFTDTPLWSGPQARLGWRHYLGALHPDAASADSDGVPPYAAAARATDLAGLPPAYVAANEFDPLRDEGITYALRLLEAGVPVELHHRPGTFHGSNFLPGAEVSERARADMYAALRRSLGRPPGIRS
ncbi:alpha/beta hydrolase [Yinghuangia soli]|uniref:Alpha/beta hydrolase n=1 Tax=Yinghuangia soli TaxID=2908204 RepID=A0AA41Q6W0_9ACTN|nr:alpha/beta hydrolase [Yinghuangia soli]MCF2532040.1 alpha/beta hydrolase [Yinghuangia soli]